LRAAVLDDAVNERLAPPILKTLAAPTPSPKVAQAFVIAPVGLTAHQRYQSVRAARGIKRADQWLGEADRAVWRGEVGPGFERMRRGQMPDRGFGRFIEIETEMEAERSAGHQSRKVEITRRRCDGIRIEDKKRLNLPHLQIRRRLRQRSSLASGRRWSKGVDRRSQPIVDPDSERARWGGQRRARENKPGAGPPAGHSPPWRRSGLRGPEDSVRKATRRDGSPTQRSWPRSRRDALQSSCQRKGR
jgi:hypothetical protein